MTKLYVSRYSNKDLAETNAVKLGISLGRPRFKVQYEIKGNIYVLAPNRAIFNLDKVNFTKRYKEQLDKLGVEKIKAILAEYGYGEAEEMILLCYEDITTEKWCHRTVFAEWWQEKTGEEVPEYKDSYTAEATKEKKKREEEESKKQVSLFDLLF